MVRKPVSLCSIEGMAASEEELLAFLESQFAKWWVPDDVVFLDEIPKTSVGKFLKAKLRDNVAEIEIGFTRIDKRAISAKGSRSFIFYLFNIWNTCSTSLSPRPEILIIMLSSGDNVGASLSA